MMLKMKVSKRMDSLPTAPENNSPDTIEMLYIESPSIGLVEFRCRIEQIIKQEVANAKYQEDCYLMHNPSQVGIRRKAHENEMKRLATTNGKGE